MAKILIVGDEEIIRNMYQKLLQNHGYEVIMAEDGEEGLKTAFVEHPDLILLDINMPKMDGITMLKALREDEWGKNVIVFMLTNVNKSHEFNESIQSNIVKYIIKSDWKPDSILENIKSVLNYYVKDSVKKILIIDDDQILLNMYAKKLSSANYQVFQAQDGKIGLTLAQNAKPDLILLDIMLPGGVNGFDILEQLKRSDVTKQIPVVILTNLDSEEDVAKKIGAVTYLVKANTSIDLLVSKVNAILI